MSNNQKFYLTQFFLILFLTAGCNVYKKKLFALIESIIRRKNLFKIGVQW